MPEELEGNMPIGEAARELNVTEAMAYRMVRDGRLVKTIVGTVGPEGEAMQVSVESVVQVKRALIQKLERRLEKLKAGRLQ